MVTTLKRLLSNPFLIITVLILAIYFGLNYPELAKGFERVGGYYINLLKMIVLPYLFVTITLGICRVASDPNSARYTWRLVITYPLAMLFAAALAVGACLLMPPAGPADQAKMIALGNIMTGDASFNSDTDAKVTIGAPKAEDADDSGNPNSASPMLDRFFPDNIFAALSAGDTLKVVIFCIIFGAALAKHSDEGSHTLQDLFRVVQMACIEVIQWLNLLLPFALFSMISAQVASVGIGPLVSLGPFVIVQVGTGLALILIATFIIARRARMSPWAVVRGLRETIILAITTRSSFACIPVAVREMTEKLHFDRYGTDLVLPLGTTICRIGSVPYFVIATVFIAEVYGVDLDLQKLIVIIFCSVAAGFASSGATGAIGVVLISIVARPLGLPVEAAIALFIAVDPILDVVRTLVLVYCNCALSALITPHAKEPSVIRAGSENLRAAQ